MAAYLAALADGRARAATIARRLVVISQAHRAAGLPSPTTSSLVRRTHAGIRRSIGTTQLGKAPAKVDDLKLMLGVVPDTRVGLRTCACLPSVRAPAEHLGGVTRYRWPRLRRPLA